MKKLAIVLVLGIGTLAACRKDKDSTPTPDKLQGTWEATRQIEVQYENDVEKYRDTNVVDPGDMQLVFKGDSLLISERNSNVDRYTYFLNGNELAMKQGSNGQFLTLRWFNDTQMSMYFEDSRTSNTGVRRKNTTEIFLRKK